MPSRLLVTDILATVQMWQWQKEHSGFLGRSMFHMCVWDTSGKLRGMFFETRFQRLDLCSRTGRDYCPKLFRVVSWLFRVLSACVGLPAQSYQPAKTSDLKLLRQISYMGLPWVICQTDEHSLFWPLLPLYSVGTISYLFKVYGVVSWYQQEINHKRLQHPNERNNLVVAFDLYEDEGWRECLRWKIFPYSPISWWKNINGV